MHDGEMRSLPIISLMSATGQDASTLLLMGSASSLSTGLVNDIFQVQTTQLPQSTYTALQNRFTKEKVFLEIIDSLTALDHGKSLRVQKRARHKAKGYMIEDGRSWQVGDGSGTNTAIRDTSIRTVSKRSLLIGLQAQKWTNLS